jgi:hypothetical protein
MAEKAVDEIDAFPSALPTLFHEDGGKPGKTVEDY